MNNMESEIRALLQTTADRLARRQLWGRAGDQLSMRLPGTNDFLWQSPEQEQPASASADSPPGELARHAAIYQLRPDAGAVLFSTTTWSEQVAELNRPIPTLFDEPARHIGPVAAPVRAEDLQGLQRAISNGSNAAIVGNQFLRIGMTADRVTFNTELFEKCAMAWVIAYTCGQRVRTVPGWVRYIAGRRLKKDQRRAAEAYQAGQIPQGMNAY